MGVEKEGRREDTWVRPAQAARMLGVCTNRAQQLGEQGRIGMRFDERGRLYSVRDIRARVRDRVRTEHMQRPVERPTVPSLPVGISFLNMDPLDDDDEG